MPENENIQQENPQEVNDISQEQTIEQFQHRTSHILACRLLRHKKSSLRCQLSPIFQIFGRLCKKNYLCNVIV